MKALIPLTICCIASTLSFAQRMVINNKSDLYLLFGTSSSKGSSQVGTSPALIANMKNGSSIAATYAQRIAKSVYAGASINLARFSNWSDPQGSRMYDGTTSSFLSAGPVIVIKSEPVRLYSFKTLRPFLAFVPSLNYIKTVTAVQSGINNTDPNIPLTVSSTRFGFELRLGIDAPISNSAGISLSYAYHVVESNSKVFPETEYQFSSLRIGFFVRLMKDRRYKYEGL